MFQKRGGKKEGIVTLKETMDRMQLSTWRDWKKIIWTVISTASKWRRQNNKTQRIWTHLILQRLRGPFALPPPCGFSKYVFSKERWKAWLFIFPENSIEIRSEDLKNFCLYKLFSLVFLNILDFLKLKKLMTSLKTDDVSIFSAYSLNRLFNNFIVILISDIFFMKYEGGVKLTPSQKKLPSKSPALLGLNSINFHFTKGNQRKNVRICCGINSFTTEVVII